VKHSGCHGHSHDRDEALTKALERLKASGLKITQPRQSLIKAIVAMNGPFTAEELSKESKKSLKSSGASGKKTTPDLVTVYRSLTSFSEIGLLSKVEFGDGVIRYELADEGAHHHHHIVCTVCKKVEPVNFCVIQGQEQILSQMGYSNLSHRLEFFGTCPSCHPRGSHP
jgi:Fur family ferric uptake transcriptional regulator